MDDAESRVLEYVAAWNDHNSEMAAAQFVEAGTYTDPTVDGELSPGEFEAHARTLLNAFPDLEIEVQRLTEIRPDVVLLEWVVRGTNTGPFEGHPPTGTLVTVPGVDVIELVGEGILSITGYFDPQSYLEQLS